MTAERLRQAAARLRELATLATPGPWEVRQVHDGPNWASEDDGRLVAPVGRDYPIQPGGGEAEDYGMETPDANYIATMHPPVALALADWLASVEVTFYVGETPEEIHALAVADAILGEA